MRISGKIAAPATLLMGTLALSACGGIKTSAPDINNPQYQNVPVQQQGGGDSLFTLGKGVNGGASANTNIQVNAYLWRATLDTLSFMPMVSADPFGGVIITDWYTPPASPGERFKVNAYIVSKDLTADSIQVSVFHQTQENGQWADTPADPSLASGLEDRILSRAADLQAEAQNTK